MTTVGASLSQERGCQQSLLLRSLEASLEGGGRSRASRRRSTGEVAGRKIRAVEKLREARG